jgi:uncharacterized RDD family membrane protein YckC
VDSTFDATVARVGHTVGEVALDATNATAQQVIEELEPYLIEEAIPRIVEGITPYLTQDVIPEILAGINDHLTTVTIPEVVDGVTGHLVEVTVPEVVTGVTPRLVDDLLPRLLADLQPYLEQQLVPHIVEALVPYIEKDIAPRLIDGLMPTITTEVAPQLIDALMPKIRDDIAPDLLDALMPRIETEVAPQLIDGLLPMIRRDVVPQILDDIVDDPRIRDLIREQSQGLLLDTMEGFRGRIADVDTVVDTVGRKLTFRPPRPRQDTALQMVLAEVSPDATAPLRLAFDDLSRQRAEWRRMPAPPAPPGRSFTYAGAATRALGLAIDLLVVGYLNTVLFSTLGGLIDSLFAGSPPEWIALTLLGLAASVIPTYLGTCYWLLGRSLGMSIVGTRVCTPDGRRPGFWRAMVRGWVGMLLLPIWAITAVVSLFDAKRRSLLDLLVHTEVRYSVPETQQRRHVRDALQEEQKRARTV